LNKKLDPLAKQYEFPGEKVKEKKKKKGTKKKTHERRNTPHRLQGGNKVTPAERQVEIPNPKNRTTICRDGK